MLEARFIMFRPELEMERSSGHREAAAAAIILSGGLSIRHHFFLLITLSRRITTELWNRWIDARVSPVRVGHADRDSKKQVTCKKITEKSLFLEKCLSGLGCNSSANCGMTACQPE